MSQRPDIDAALADAIHVADNIDTMPVVVDGRAGVLFWFSFGGADAPAMLFLPEHADQLTDTAARLAAALRAAAHGETTAIEL